ncbi:hypothetical protein HN937_27070 [Candidatus Poribacteria bacterium]|nr:hypothetical protein [Candidatus Poribacteria bacterium]
MRRPIEESIYDPTLTRDEKLEILYRHYSVIGKTDGEPDNLLHAVMSEGLTDIEAAKYWTGAGGSRKWARYHAAAAVRSDPNAVEALALWAQLIPVDRVNDREAAYLAVLERAPTHRGSLAYLASVTTMDRPYESMEYAQRLLDVHPDALFGYESMGLAYERVGDPDTAASYYEKGIEATGSGFLLQVLDRLQNGESWIQPIDTVQPTVPSDDLPNSPTPSSPPAATSPPDEPPSRGPVPKPPAPAPAPTPPPETPEPVERYQNALNDYRAMADEYESITGQTYRGVANFCDYLRQSSNPMACRYVELAQQHLDAGRAEEAASVLQSAARHFPDDPLIQERMKRRR